MSGFHCSEYECSRPLRLAIFGAKSVGKTSIALQYLSEHVGDTEPTTIEDIFRKDVSISITDKNTLTIFLSKWKERRDSLCQERKLSTEKRKQSSQEKLSQKDFSVSSTLLNFSMEITDTAGYTFEETRVNRSSRSSFMRKISKQKRSEERSKLRRRRSESKTILRPKDRSRSTSSVGNLSLLARRDNCLEKCDGLILVFNVLDRNSLKAIQEIRDRFVRLHASKSTSNGKRSWWKKCLCPSCAMSSYSSDTDYNIPPTFVIGTHADVRSKRMISEASSRLYNVNFSRDRTMLNARRREKQKSAMPESGVVQPQDVYEIINGWTECAGFAEVTSCDHSLVRQIFELLALSSVLSSSLADWSAK